MGRRMAAEAADNSFRSRTAPRPDASRNGNFSRARRAQRCTRVSGLGGGRLELEMARLAALSRRKRRRRIVERRRRRRCDGQLRAFGRFDTPHMPVLLPQKRYIGSCAAAAPRRTGSVFRVGALAHLVREVCEPPIALDRRQRRLALHVASVGQGRRSGTAGAASGAVIHLLRLHSHRHTVSLIWAVRAVKGSFSEGAEGVDSSANWVGAAGPRGADCVRLPRPGTRRDQRVLDNGGVCRCRPSGRRSG